MAAAPQALTAPVVDSLRAPLVLLEPFLIPWALLSVLTVHQETTSLLQGAAHVCRATWVLLLRSQDL